MNVWYTRVDSINSIFQNTLELFGKDIAPNFIFVFTFSEFKQPTAALEAVQNKEICFGRYWDLVK
jgi:hypothetical protein